MLLDKFFNGELLGKEKSTGPLGGDFEEVSRLLKEHSKRISGHHHTPRAVDFSVGEGMTIMPFMPFKGEWEEAFLRFYKAYRLSNPNPVNVEHIARAAFAEALILCDKEEASDNSLDLESGEVGFLDELKAL